MKIAIVGDVFITKPQNVSIDKSVIDLFNGCQYRVVNLEGPINGGEEIVPPKKSGSSLKQPTSIIGFLKSLNVDAVTLSNNHIHYCPLKSVNILAKPHILNSLTTV